MQAIKQIITTTIDNASATTTDSQMPLILKNIGSIITQGIWKTSVLKNKMNADIKPLFNAVKNADAKAVVLRKLDTKNPST